MLFLIIFDSILIGTSLAPQIGVLFGFSSPESVHDPYWQSWSVRLIEILSLVLTLGVFALMLSGFVRHRLIQYDVA